MAEDKYKTLRELSHELAKVNEVERLLDEVWAWYGPHGPETRNSKLTTAQRQKPENQQIVKNWSMPDELQTKLRRHFKFDE